MLFDDLLAHLGVGILFAAFVFPLWKADDAISPTFRDDIRDLIIGARFARTNEVADFVNSVFAYFFGPKLISIRSASLCLLISTIIAITTIGSRASYQIFFQDVSTFLRAFAILILPLSVTSFASLLWTRLLIGWASKSGRLIIALFSLIFDFLLLVLIGALPTVIIDQNFDFLSLQVAVLYSLMAPVFAMGQEVMLHGQEISLAMLPVVTAWYTSAIYSLFIWISVFGLLVANQALRLNTIQAALTYALPFDTRPLRSLGLIIVFCSLFVLLFFNLVSLAASGLGVLS